MAKVLRQLDDEAVERPFNKSQFVRLMGYMKPYKRNVVLSIILMAIATLCNLGNTYVMSRAVGQLNTGVFTGVIAMLCAMMGMTLVSCLCTRQRVRWMDVAGRKAIAQLREDLFEHIQNMSFSFFDTRSAGKLLVRVINDVNSLNDLFSNGIINVIVDCFTVILLLVIMFAVNVRLTLIAMCIMPFLWFGIFKI